MKFLYGLALVLVSGCAPLLSFPGAPANLPERQYNHTETETRSPRFVVIDGKSYAVLDQIERTYSVGLKQIDKPKTFWQKLWGAFGPWAFLWAILMIAGIFFPPVAALMGLFNKGVSKGVKRIVSGVDEALSKLGDEDRKKVLDELSKHYDDSTKALVRKVKGGLK